MWVTRDKNGTLTLWVHDYPTRKNNGNWVVFREDDEYWGIIIDKKLFPDLTCEDEPLEVELNPVQYFKFKLSEEAKKMIEKETGITVDELRHMPLKTALK